MKRLKKLLLIFSLISLTFLQCGCNLDPNVDSILNLKSEYKKGMKAFEAKNYDEAIVNFTNAINSDPEHYTTYCYLASCYLQKSDEKNAERILQEAVKKFPQEWNAYALLGDIKRMQHNYPIALEYYKKALALESMPEEFKDYYTKLQKEIIKEQNAWNAKGNIPIREKINPKNAAPSYIVEISLDPKIWEKAYEVSNDKNGIIEYGKKGEDVKNYKWTELVTIQYFALNSSFQYSPAEYLSAHISPIETMAKDTHKSFVRKTLNQTNSEIVYEWSFDQGKESEIARIVQTPNAIYHLHYAKKGVIDEKDKAKWVGILKAAKVGD